MDYSNPLSKLCDNCKKRPASNIKAHAPAHLPCILYTFASGVDDLIKSIETLDNRRIFLCESIFYFTGAYTLLQKYSRSVFSKA